MTHKAISLRRRPLPRVSRTIGRRQRLVKQDGSSCNDPPLCLALINIRSHAWLSRHSQVEEAVDRRHTWDLSVFEEQLFISLGETDDCSLMA